MRASLLLLLLLILSGCAQLGLPQPGQPAAATPAQPAATYTPASFDDLPGWGDDVVEAALPALTLSCKRLTSLPKDRSLGANGRMGKVGDWTDFCVRITTLSSPHDLRTLLTEKLRPWAVSENGGFEGLFTGYYEASLNGSRSRHDAYQTPLYRKPSDLVMVELGDFRDELKGERIAGRIVGGYLKPYADRAAITNGALKNRNLELVWINDPLAAFFVQVQGSGRVQLDDGDVLRLGYDGQNGHPYVAIGKLLVEAGEIKQEDVSMQSITAWLKAHPDRAEDLLNRNPSYVFFRAQPGIEGPEGAAHVPLTPRRSLAVDNRFIGYHVPVWLDVEDPRKSGDRLRQLLVAQDTGGAIRGVVRGDLFWGHGEAAEAAAGVMRSRGRYFALLPVAIDPRTP